MKNTAQTIDIDGGYFFEKGSYRCRSEIWPDPWIFWPAVAVVAGIVWWGDHQALGWYWIVFPGLIVALIGLSVSRQFTIEPSNNVVRIQTRLFNRRVLKEQLLPFSDFKFVSVKEGNASGEDGIIFHVLLQHNSGRKMRVAYFHTPRPAEELAWRISCDTGIKLKGDENYET